MYYKHSFMSLIAIFHEPSIGSELCRSVLAKGASNLTGRGIYSHGNLFKSAIIRASFLRISLHP